MVEVPIYYPPIMLPGSEAWSRAYDMGQRLEVQFPGQEAYDFCCAVSYNDIPGEVAGQEITNLVCTQIGENDGAEWVWRVSFSGSRWQVMGGCDYTGWDCQSWLEWKRI